MDKSGDDITLAIPKEALYEWFYARTRRTACPGCKAPASNKTPGGHAHWPDCDYVRWVIKVHPQYSTKTGQPIYPTTRKP